VTRPPRFPDGRLLDACSTCGHERYVHEHFSTATHCGVCAECNTFRSASWWERIRDVFR
jgi:ribosomal protein S27E